MRIAPRPRSPRRHRLERHTAPGGTTTTTPAPPPKGATGIGAPATAPSTPAHPTVPGNVAKIIHGIAYAPAYAPIQVKRIDLGRQQDPPQAVHLGGGHGVWNDAGYDCSGSVSYVLHAAGLLKTSMDSREFETWGLAGLGQWVTVYTNPATPSSRWRGSGSTPRLKAIRTRRPAPARGGVRC